MMKRFLFVTVLALTFVGLGASASVNEQASYIADGDTLVVDWADGAPAQNFTSSGLEPNTIDGKSYVQFNESSDTLTSPAFDRSTDRIWTWASNGTVNLEVQYFNSTGGQIGTESTTVSSKGGTIDVVNKPQNAETFKVQYTLADGSTTASVREVRALDLTTQISVRSGDDSHQITNGENVSDSTDMPLFATVDALPEYANFEVQIDVVDSNSNVVKTRTLTDDSQEAFYSTSSEKFILDPYLDLNGLPKGEYTVESQATGATTANDTVTFNFEYPSDTSAPVVEEVTAQKTDTQMVDVSVRSSDDMSGVQSVKVNFAGETFTLDRVSGTQTFGGTLNVSVNPSGQDFTVVATDNAGNSVDSTATVALDSYIVGQSVTGQVATGVSVMPDYYYQDGSVDYYFVKTITTRNGNTISESSWSKVSFPSDLDGSTTRQLTEQTTMDQSFDTVGEYSRQLIVAQASSTYDWGENGTIDSTQEWNPYNVEIIDQQTYPFQVVRAEETPGALTALQNWFSNNVQAILDSIAALFEDNPTAIPQPEAPPEPA